MMKKAGISIGAIVLIAVIYLGWDAYKQYSPEPPKGYITINNEKTMMVTGTYSWKGWGVRVIADSFSPPSMLAERDYIKVVNKDTKITFSFDEHPNSSTINIWDMKTEKVIHRDIPEKDLDFAKLALQQGEYAVEVKAKWDKGEAIYVSQIEWQGSEPKPEVANDDGYLELTPTPFFPEQIELYIGTAEPIPLEQVKNEAYVTGTITHRGYQSMVIYSKVPNGYRQQIKAKVEGDNLVVEIDEKHLTEKDYYLQHLVYCFKINEVPQFYKVILNGKEVKHESIGYGTE
jgi:hypothetical protein